MDDVSDTQIASDQADPVARWLGLVVGLLTIVVLAGVLALILYLRGIQAPRTALEREIARYSELADSGSASQDDLIALALAYAQAGRGDDARAAIDHAYDAGETAAVVTADAEVARLLGRYDAAVERYDRAEELAVAEYERILEDLRAKQVVEEPPNTQLARVLYGRGLSLRELGEDDRAVEDLEGAVAITPTDATLLVSLGDAYAATGDRQAAEDAYREALRFVPDDADARAGLARLEGDGE